MLLTSESELNAWLGAFPKESPGMILEEGAKVSDGGGVASREEPRPLRPEGDSPQVARSLSPPLVVGEGMPASGSKRMAKASPKPRRQSRRHKHQRCLKRLLQLRLPGKPQAFTRLYAKAASSHATRRCPSRRRMTLTSSSMPRTVAATMPRRVVAAEYGIPFSETSSEVLQNGGEARHITLADGRTFAGRTQFKVLGVTVDAQGSAMVAAIAREHAARGGGKHHRQLCWKKIPPADA